MRAKPQLFGVYPGAFNSFVNLSPGPLSCAVVILFIAVPLFVTIRLYREDIYILVSWKIVPSARRASQYSTHSLSKRLFNTLIDIFKKFPMNPITCPTIFWTLPSTVFLVQVDNAFQCEQLPSRFTRPLLFEKRNAQNWKSKRGEVGSYIFSYLRISQRIPTFVSEEHKVLVVRRFPRIAFQNPRALVRWSGESPSIGSTGSEWRAFVGRTTELRVPSAALELTNRPEAGRRGHSLSNTNLQGVGDVQEGNGTRLLVQGGRPVNVPLWRPRLSGQSLCKILRPSRNRRSRSHRKYISLPLTLLFQLCLSRVYRISFFQRVKFYASRFLFKFNRCA